MSSPAASHLPMLALIKVFIDIVLWRKGPQHLPASGLLLTLTIAGYFAMSFTLRIATRVLAGDAASRLPQPHLAQSAIELALLVGWIWLLLALFKRTHRFWQSAIALVGTDIVMSPLIVGTGVLATRLGQAHPLALPIWLALVGGLVWYGLVIANVLRSAIETTLFAAVILTLLYGLSAYFITVRLFGAPA